MAGQSQVAAIEVLTDEQAAQVEAELVPHAGAWNPQQLNSRLRRVVTRVDPEGAARRAEARRAARHVRHEVLEDGAGLFQVYGDGERTHLAYQRVQAIARELKQTSGDGRTVDQIANRRPDKPWTSDAANTGHPQPSPTTSAPNTPPASHPAALDQPTAATWTTWRPSRPGQQLQAMSVHCVAATIA